jgi:integrative and conjugative element protein (TIGR02256 family)
MKYTASNKGNIKIGEEALQRMSAYMQLEKDHCEAGGVILGRFIRNSKDIVIDKVSVPMIGDKRSRFYFIRGAKMHQRIIDTEWNRSNGTCNYLGEWHTHPEPYPEPSKVDIANWKQRLQEDTFFSRYLYFIIVGQKETYMWEGDRRTLKIKKLKRI